MDLYNGNERFISILSDYGFKVTFGNESDTRFLRKAKLTVQEIAEDSDVSVDFVIEIQQNLSAN